MSVAEIAVRIGVGEKRMRAIIREILARRMPGPPEEFVAIQMSRLNEALLVSFSAMSPSNLKAVDQVVKIVRDLDRYGGAYAAERARPDAPRLDAPGEADVAFAKAWLCSAELARDWGDDGPENPPQISEKINSAPGNRLAPHRPSGDGGPSTSDERGEGRGGERGRLAADARPAPHPNLLPVDGVDGEQGQVDYRPENPVQGSEKIESAPGMGADLEVRADALPELAAFPNPVPTPMNEAQSMANVAAPAQKVARKTGRNPLKSWTSAPGSRWLPGAGGVFVSRAFPNPPCPEFVRLRARPSGLAA